MKYCGQTNIPGTDTSPIPCEKYISTDCVIYPPDVPYLGLVDGSTATETFDAIIISLVDARNRVYILENSVSTLDHGYLAGLLDDDHPQYLNTFRADVWLATKSTSDLTEGGNYYFTETRVLATTLTGLTNGTNTPITDTDTVLSAFENLQAQLSNIAVPEYTLSEVTNNIFSLDKDGTPVTSIDLSPYLDDRARITSGTLNPTDNLMTLTRDDDSTINVDLSTLNVDLRDLLDVNSIQWDTTPDLLTPKPGLQQWNEDEDTLDIHANGVTYQVGQELAPLYKNNTGATITNGTPVMFAGTVGASGRVRIQPAIADGSLPSFYIIGVATQDILDGADGHVTWFGKVRMLNTTGALYGETWNEGDLLYVSAITAGHLTNVKPNAPNLQISVAAIIHVHANAGSILVRPTWKDNFVDLADVNGTPLTADGQIPIWHHTEQYFDFDKNINDYLLIADLPTHTSEFTNDGPDGINPYITALDLPADLYLGVFVSKAALEIAYPTASPGEYANVDAGIGSDVERYLWDDDDSIWVLGEGTHVSNTSELVNDGPDGVNPYITALNLPIYTGDLINNGNGDLDLLGNPIIFITSNDVVPPISEQIDVSATYVSDLTFYVVANRFPVNNLWYSATAANVTLDVADLTFDRIDLLVGKTDGTVARITGIPSATPAQPNWDVTTEYPIRFVFIPATATTLTTYTDVAIFDEGVNEPTEWTYAFTNPGTTVSASDVFTGSNAIEHTSIGNSYGEVHFTSVTTINASEINTISFAVKLKEQYNASIILNLVSNGNTIKNYTIGNGQYGFSKSDLNWQIITVPVASANLTSIQIDELMFNIGRNGFDGFFLDTITTQISTEEVVQPPVVEHPQYTSAFINNGEDNTSRYVEEDELGATAFSNSYNDLDDLPEPSSKSIENRYTNLTALISDQVNQTDQAVQFVNDASDDPTVGAGYAYYEYLGTTSGTLTDYRKLSEEESMDLAIGIAKHVQSTPATLWIFSHNLNEQFPTLTVYDENNQVVLPETVEAIDINTIHITFPEAAVGTAVAVLGNAGNNITNALKVFEQETPSQSWAFQHDLNSLTPLVTVYGDDNKVIIPADIEAIDANNILVTFSAATIGKISVSGGLSEGLTFDSVGFEHLATNLNTREDMAGTVIDWLTAPTKVKTLTGSAAFTDTNLPQGIDTRLISMYITGDFALTFPAYYSKITGAYDGTKVNQFVIECVDGNSGSESIYYSINTVE